MTISSSTSGGIVLSDQGAVIKIAPGEIAGVISALKTLKATPIGHRIIDERTSRKLTLSELAAKAKISKGLLHNIESSPKANHGFRTLTKISAAMSMTVSELTKGIA